MVYKTLIHLSTVLKTINLCLINYKLTIYEAILKIYKDQLKIHNKKLLTK